MRRLLALLALVPLAACGPDDARHVKIELELAREPCAAGASDCSLALSGNGIVVEARAPDGSDDLAWVAGQSTLYAELSAPGGVLVMVEIAYAAGTTPRIRYREVADGTLLFSGRIEDARIAVPEASESWLDRGEFSFVARAEVGAEARRVITNGRVIPLDPERVRVTPVPPRGGGVDVDTEVVIVVDSGPDYDGSGGCEGDTVDDPDPTPDPWEPGPITSDPTDPTPTDPIPTDPTPDVEDPTTDPTDPPPSTGAPPTADDPSGGCDEGTSDASSGGCDEGTSGDGGGCDSAETESGGGCEASDGDGSGGCGGDTSSSGGGCEGDTSSSAGGCDCEGEAYAATAARGLDAAPAHRPARRPFDLERAVASVFRLAWPIVLAGLWNRRRRYFLARGLAVSDALDVRRDDDTTTTVPDKTS